MELRLLKNQELDKHWKDARLGIIIFCIVHLIYEGVVGNNGQLAGAAVCLNYLISAWYIKREIAKKKEIKNYLLLGLAVSCVVFLIRLALGTAIYLLLTK